MTNASGNDERKITSLRQLPQETQPPRDLWAGIEARISAERQAAGDGLDAGDRNGARSSPREAGARTRGRRRYTSAPLSRWIAVAATIAALAVGVWIGRNALPTNGSATQTTARSEGNGGTPGTGLSGGAKALQAAYMSDPKYRQARAALVKSLEEKLASLPPDSRAKVLSSLATIHKSIEDLEAALGKDPTNALLQELLLNTYQDEMRVLTTVQDASEAGKGI
jgi:hypothetical protein